MDLLVRLFVCSFVTQFVFYEVTSVYFVKYIQHILNVIHILINLYKTPTEKQLQH